MAEGFSDIVPGGDFPPATREMWEERARATLKGRPLRSLWAETPEGIAIPPVCAADEVAPLPLPPRPRPLVAQGGWAILQRIDHPDVDGARAQIAEELAMGAHGLVLVVADAPGADGWGLLPDEVPAVLDDVDCEHMPLRLDAGPHWHAAAGALLDLAAGRHYELSRSPWLLAVDPLGAAASSGRLPERAPLARRLAALLEWAAALGLKRAVLAADGRPWHAAGCGDAQQLGILLAATAEYLRLLREGGMAPADVAPRIAWLLAVDAGQFTTIAALRAARLLHARLLEVLEVPFAPLPLLAESAWRMMTRRDPWVNMLRTTSAAFAAGLGSADAVTLLPFTHALGLADPFARRMARNMQIIAREEASLHRVEDPLAGSAWVETATRALCERAWRVFADIEAAGGLHAALAAGSLREMIEEIAARRRRDVATRRLPITGVSAYPALEERRPDVLDLPRRPSPPVVDELPHRRCPPLRPRRLAAPFEELRDAADAHAARTGHRPAVCVVGFGLLAEHGARTTWAVNLLAAGGIAGIECRPDTYHPGEHGTVVVLSAADERHAAESAAAIEALRLRGATHVFAVAGEKVAPALRDAGALEVLHEGMDVLAFLRELHALLGIVGDETPADGGGEAS